MLSSATVQDSPPRPLIAELVAPDATSVAARRLAAVAVAITPLLVRVAWWWWSQGRAERDSVEPIIVTPGLVEHTELRMTKRLLWEGRTSALATVLEMAAPMQALGHATADHDEAVEAFLEKRRPQFKGD